MNTVFEFDLDGVQVTLTGNSGDEIAQVLRENELSPLLHNNYYYSRTTQARTGNGWIRLQDMNENFIVNSFAARLSESIRDIYKNVQASDSEIAESLFVGFLADLTNMLEYSASLGDPNNNAHVLSGLVHELERRQIEESLNSEFDAEPDDVVSSDSCSPNCGCNDGVVDSGQSLYSSTNLSFLDRA